MITLKESIIKAQSSDDMVLESAARAIELLKANIDKIFNVVDNKSKITRILKNPVLVKMILKYCKEVGINHRRFDTGLLIEIIHDFLVVLLHYFSDDDDDDIDFDDDDDEFVKGFRKFKSRFDEKDFMSYFNDSYNLMKMENYDEHDTYIGFIIFKFLFHNITGYEWPYNLAAKKSGLSGFFDMFKF